MPLREPVMVWGIGRVLPWGAQAPAGARGSATTRGAATVSVANPSTPKEDEDEDDSQVAAGGS